MNIRRLLAGAAPAIAALAIAYPGTSDAQGVNRPVTRRQADGFYVDIKGDTMTGALLVPALTLSGDFTTSTGIIESTTADGTVGLIFNIANAHTTANLVEFREENGPSRFTLTEAGQGIFAGSVSATNFTASSEFRANNRIVNISGTNGCVVSSGRVCFVNGTDFNGDIIDSRASTPVTIADVDGLQLAVSSSLDARGSITNSEGAARLKLTDADGIFLNNAISSEGTSTVEIDDANGLELSAGPLIVSGSDPVLSACGTTPTVVGADAAGQVTIGTGTVLSCTVTFAAAYTNAPTCVVAGDNASETYAATTSTTALTITSATSMPGDVISYICIGL